MRFFAELLTRQSTIRANYRINSICLIRRKSSQVSLRPAIDLKLTTMLFKDVIHDRTISPRLNFLIKQRFFIPS